MSRCVVGLTSSFLLCGLTLLSGCTGSEAARAFGLERSMPDEYTVTTRAPLSMPPMNELARPVSGAERPQDESERLQALETLSPDVALHGESGASSSGQTILVQSATAASDASDEGGLEPNDSGFVDQIMFWHGGTAGSVVDADKENDRLKKNAALGKPLTSGATPTKPANKKSWYQPW
ncbi:MULTISPECIES: DUF3035 domain-containing protein [Acetobacter]|uniref:DUF3035 domain-containing protein n=1 Tax=Acetobacter thailandicus TaxID=1502842 RepID=A0ABT3QER7_9PROT|nr:MULTISPECIES: DUF3035 domain-containing protein [Acetobacter]MBS0959925.1 DUF3035 domain-containing protein [Acetobacter thailandicus]MBS0979254.1 DUF3035 domain-containing protein [Acetobacter thailandicus]MBS0985740.1 DUF3035 domain-containing protein [Acetobacter thailandicus]MBS1002372.1 DUF3035 domain-containing protein [Acetobacter thailandicus]MCX2563782.1 DUF3035 domain-containing protein [Acetobacter thailandicus]